MSHHLLARSTSQIVHPIEDRLLTEIEAAQLRGQSVRTLQAERLNGSGCPFVKLGRSVRYRRSDVLRFIESRVRTFEGIGAEVRLLPLRIQLLKLHQEHATSFGLHP